MTEADTGRKYVLPKLIDAGWDNDPHSFTEQKTFTRPKMLYLADRNFLIDDPKDKVFTPFDEARWKIENGEVNYQYSLRQGIEDGFLAPYRVHRGISTWDASGWRPSQGDRDRYGRAIPDEEYQTKDFERVVALRARTEAIARQLTDFLKKTDRFAKTIVFCVDQDHADKMRRTLNNCNADLVQQYPDCVCRMRQLERFAEQEDTLNAFLVSPLLDLKAEEALPMMERAFAADSVDESVCGDWEDVEIEFGLKDHREKPRTYGGIPPLFTHVPPEPGDIPTQSRTSKTKDKAKRKQ